MHGASFEEALEELADLPVPTLRQWIKEWVRRRGLDAFTKEVYAEWRRVPPRVSATAIGIMFTLRDRGGQKRSCRIHSEQRATSSWRIGPLTMLPTELFNGQSSNSSIGLW